MIREHCFGLHTDYVDQPIVNDDTVSRAPDTVTINTINRPPVGDAGAVMVKVETENLNEGQFQDGKAILTGQTVDGVEFTGSDEITIVPPEG